MRAARLLENSDRADEIREEKGPASRVESTLLDSNRVEPGVKERRDIERTHTVP